MCKGVSNCLTEMRQELAMFLERGEALCTKKPAPKSVLSKLYIYLPLFLSQICATAGVKSADHHIFMSSIRVASLVLRPQTSKRPS